MFNHLNKKKGHIVLDISLMIKVIFVLVIRSGAARTHKDQMKNWNEVHIALVTQIVEMKRHQDPAISGIPRKRQDSNKQTNFSLPHHIHMSPILFIASSVRGSLVWQLMIFSWQLFCLIFQQKSDLTKQVHYAHTVVSVIR